MFPDLGSLGPFTFHSYGLAVALGILFSLAGMERLAKRTGFPPQEKVFGLVVVTVFSGFLGARLFYVLQEWDWYQTHLIEIFQIWKGGFVYYGGMVAAFLGFWIYTRREELGFLRAADFAIPFVALAHAFGRVGCFLNGCCYGKICPFPWAVQFPALPHPVHPTQLYEALWNLGVFAVLRYRYGRRLTPPERRGAGFTGEILALYLILYPAGRLGIEFFRGDQALFLGSLTLHQVLSAVFILLGIWLYGYQGIHRLREG